MRLALKLVLAFVLGNILLAGIYGYLTVQREARMFRQSASAEAETLGGAMEGPLTDAWQRTGHQGVMQWVQKANDGQKSYLRIRWVWFDSQPGDPCFPSASPDRLTAISIEQHVAVEAPAPDGTPYLHVYWPVHLSSDRRGGLEFSHSMTELDRNKWEIVERTAWLIGGMVLLSGILAAALGVRLVGRPLRQLIEKTRRIAAGDLQGAVHLRSHDELAELADSLNGMCEQLAESQGKIREETAARIAAMEQLRHADRLKTVGRLASGIAHELGTPLNVVSGRASLIVSGKLPPGEIEQSAAAIKTEADKMTRIIRQLLDFGRSSMPHKVAVDLRQVVSQTVDLLRTLGEKHHVLMKFAPGGDSAIVEADVGQIQQVLTNLMVNAVQAMPKGGDLEVAIRRQTAAPPEKGGDGHGAYYGVEIRDQGAGIAEENMPHLFEPFFTTKAVGDGTGLGLSIAYGIVQEHGGWIDVISRPGQGSCFTVFLPERPHS
jgi:signal transduction histidine kinase